MILNDLFAAITLVTILYNCGFIIVISNEMKYNVKMKKTLLSAFQPKQ